MIDRTIQLKKFREDADDPYDWLEWRNVDAKTFQAVKKLLSEREEPMNRSGD